MKLWLLIGCIFTCPVVEAQSFTGLWYGVITRDYGDIEKTDTIRFQLEQHGKKVSGNSLMFTDSTHYIRASIEGEYIPSSNTLKLTETSVIEKKLPGKGYDFFLDIYLLNFDEKELNILTGKCIPKDDSQSYGRSKMVIKRRLFTTLE